MTGHEEIICHSQQHFEAAFAAIRLFKGATRPIVRTAPDAAAYAGVLYLKIAAHHSKNTTAGTERVVLDCGNDPSLVLSGLRIGWSNFAFTGPTTVQNKVLQLIAKYDAHLVGINQGPVLDLQSTYDPLERCQTWLNEFNRATVAG